MTRVYVPATRSSVSRLREHGTLGPAPLTAYAVTDGLRAAVADADDEEWEYLAMSAAALGSVELLADDETARVVVAVDVGDVETVVDGEPGEVRLTTEVPLRRVAAVHVDARDAEQAVGAARAARGTAAYDDALAACLDHDLQWYAVQEIDVVLDR